MNRDGERDREEDLYWWSVFAGIGKMHNRTLNTVSLGGRQGWEGYWANGGQWRGESSSKTVYSPSEEITSSGHNDNSSLGIAGSKPKVHMHGKAKSITHELATLNLSPTTHLHGKAPQAYSNEYITGCGEHLLQWHSHPYRRWYVLCH